jgi:hypothetical protein
MKRAGGIYLFAVLISFSVTAQAGALVGVKSGLGNIEVKDAYANPGSEKEDIFSAGLFAGYNFDSGLTFEVGFSGETSEEIFESYDVFQSIVMLGYTVHIGTDFSLTPKFGASMWELDTFRSGLLTFGQDRERSFDGTDSIGSLEGEYSINKLVQLNLAYTQGSYDFGELNALRFGVELDF